MTITKHGAVITLKTGVQRDGTIVARKSTCYFNTGAYADIGPRLIKNGGYGTGGPHAHPQRLGRLVRRLHQHAAGGRLPRLRRLPGGLGLRDARWT